MLCPFQHKTVHSFDLADLHSSAGFNAAQHDLAGLVRVIGPIIRADRRSGAVGDLERNAGKRLVLRALNEFLDNEGGSRLIVKNQAVGDAGAHNDILRSLIQDVTRGRFLLRHDIGAGLNFGDYDLSILVSGIEAIAGGESLIIGEQLFIGVGNFEPRSGQGLAADAVPLLDNQFSLGLVLEGQADRPALLNLDGLRLRVNDESVRGLGFRHDHALAGLQALNTDFSVGVGPVNPLSLIHI